METLFGAVPDPPKKEPSKHPIPHGTPARVCRGKANGGICEAEVYWLETSRSFLVLDRIGDTDEGTSHWLTCPDMKYFKRKPV
jgi:hypothetical protein